MEAGAGWQGLAGSCVYVPSNPVPCCAAVPTSALPCCCPVPCAAQVMVYFGVDDTATAMKLGEEAAAEVSKTFINPIKLEFEKVSQGGGGTRVTLRACLVGWQAPLAPSKQRAAGCCNLSLAITLQALLPPLALPAVPLTPHPAPPRRCTTRTC